MVRENLEKNNRFDSTIYIFSFSEISKKQELYNDSNNKLGFITSNGGNFISYTTKGHFTNIALNLYLLVCNID